MKSSVVLVAVCAVLSSTMRVHAQPDPVALLRGVQAARQPLHGRLNVSAVKRQVKPQPQEGTRELVIDFDQHRFRFLQHQMVLVASGGDARENQLKVNMLGGNLDAAANAGIGKKEERHIRTAYDGNQLADFCESKGAYIQRPERGLSQFDFDPRVFGITRLHTINYHLDHCLGLVKDRVASLVGQEVIEGRPVWHVKVSVPQADVDYHFWIEDSKGFRVHRYEYRYPSDGSKTFLVAISEYGNEKERPLLPKRVLVNEKGNGGAVEEEIEFRVTSADYSVTPDPNVFTLKGLDIPPGTMVIDERISRVAGYWTGEGLSDSYTEAKATGEKIAAKEEDVRRENSYRRWLQIGVGVLLVLVVAVIAYKRFAARRPTQPPAAT